MIKRIAAVFIGFISAFVLTGLVQMMSAKMYPPPEDLITQDLEAIERYFKALPANARLIMLVAHVLGAFVGAFIASKIADSYKLYLGLLVGVVMLVASVSYNLASFAPAWSFLSSLILTGLAAYIGARLGSRS